MGLAGLPTPLLALRRGHLALPSSPVFLAALLFLVTRAASVPVATDPAVAVGVVREEAKNLVLLVVVVTLVAAAPRLRPVAAAPVLTLAVLAGLTVVQEFVLGNGTTLHGLANVPLPSELPGLSGRHSGPELDVNFWARTLLLQVPFALSLAAGVDARDHDVRIVQSGSGADFTVQVSGRSQRDAGALAMAMVHTVSRLVNRPGGLYALQQQPG